MFAIAMFSLPHSVSVNCTPIASIIIFLAILIIKRLSLKSRINGKINQMNIEKVKVIGINKRLPVWLKFNANVNQKQRKIIIFQMDFMQSHSFDLFKMSKNCKITQLNNSYAIFSK